MIDPLKRPAILFIDVPDPDFKAFQSNLLEIGGDPTRISSEEDVVRSDYDLIITNEEDLVADFETPTLSFGSETVEVYRACDHRNSNQQYVPQCWYKSYETISRQIEVAEEQWDEETSRLIHSCLEKLSSASKYFVWRLYPCTPTDAFIAGMNAKSDQTPLITSTKIGSFPKFQFIRACSGTNFVPFALPKGSSAPLFLNCVRAIRSIKGEPTSGAPTWVLPVEAPAKPLWLRAFLRFLSTDRPDSIFGYYTDWRNSDPEWMTSPLQEHFHRLHHLENKKKSMLAELDEKIAETREAIQDQSRKEEKGVRRLLTRDGDDLVEAVTDAFKTLGFKVESMDDHHDAENGAKLEDLRVSFGEWTALVEVKGYTKGAKANDLMQVAGRPPLQFQHETDRLPNKIWHVVNISRYIHPSKRGVAISDKTALDKFEVSNGCLIDSRDLFKAISAPRSSYSKTRDSLMSATRVWPARDSELA